MSCHIRQTDRIFMTDLISDTLLTHLICQDLIKCQHVFLIEIDIEISVVSHRFSSVLYVKGESHELLSVILSHLLCRITYAKLTAFLC